MSRTAITDLAQQALTILKGLTLQGSPHYSASLSALAPHHRIPLAFILADHCFPFHLSGLDLTTAYTTYESLAKAHLSTQPNHHKHHPDPTSTITEVKPPKE